MRKIRKGDEVIVITGQDKGRRAVVLSVLDDKVLLEGLNVIKKHQKPNPGRNIAGGIIEKAMPVHISNVAIFNQATQKADRVGFKCEKTGRTKVRVFKSNGQLVSA